MDFHWKDNDKKPWYNFRGSFEEWKECEKKLYPNISCNQFQAGYVWTTKYCNISYIVETEYKGSSKTLSKFWREVYKCPPCLDANDFPYEHFCEDYCVNYDENGKKFWSFCNYQCPNTPLQYAGKFPEGTIVPAKNGLRFKSNRQEGWTAWWEQVVE
jgi:hypothetical protein